MKFSIAVFLAQIDDDPEVRIRIREFVSEKPAWYEICDFVGHRVKRAGPITVPWMAT